MKGYRAIARYQYARKIKALKPGRVQWLKLRGKRVKTYVDPEGRTLKILEAPKGLIPDRRKYKLVPSDGTLRAVPIERREREPAPKPKPTPPKAKSEPEPRPPEGERKEERKEEEPKKPEPPPKQEPPAPPEVPKPSPQKPPEPVPIGELTKKQRSLAKLVPVPKSGPIPTPYINWDAIPEKCKIEAGSISYVDYPIPGAPKGLLPELRDQFETNRRYQDVLPANVWIRGPPGTGKSQVVKKFAEDTGLPYWGIIGRQGIRAEELLGHWELKDGKTRWVEGVIPKAAKAGGILHFDEANVIEPAVLMRLDELMDNKRQLYMEETGELIKAHPDLFIIFTTNPETYEGVKNMPDPIKSRLVKKYYLDYAPEKIENRIIESKLRSMGVKPGELSVASDGSLKGAYAKDMADFMKFVQSLRAYQSQGTGEQLSYVPTTREAIGFVQDLKRGKDFFTAVETSVLSAYQADPEEYHRVKEALGSVRRQ